MPQPAPAKPPMSRTKKLLLGCLGCFGLAVIGVVVTVVIVVAWLKEETTPVHGDVLLSEDIVSIVVVEPDAKDAGVTAFVRALGEQIDRDRPQAIDPKMREAMKAMKAEDAASILLSFLPVTWARASTSGALADDPRPLELVSLSHWSNPIRRVGAKDAEEKATSSAPHGDATIWSWGSGDSAEAVAFSANHVVRGRDAKSVGDALDRLSRGGGAGGLVKELRDRLSPRPHMWGLLVNRGEAASREYGFLEGLPVSSAEVLGVAWEISVLGAESANGHFHLRARDPAVALDLQEMLGRRSEEVRQALLLEHEMESTFTQRADGLWVTVDFELKDLARRVIRAISEEK